MAISRAPGTANNPKKKGLEELSAVFVLHRERRGTTLPASSATASTRPSMVPRLFSNVFLKRLPKHLRKVRVRADSGFFSSKILDLLTSKGAEYYVVAPMKQWVQRAIYGIKTWRAIGDGYEVAESTLTMMKVDYRMVVVRKRVLKDRRPRRQLSLLHDDDGHLYDYNAIVTNSVRLPENVWRFYNQRACCENFYQGRHLQLRSGQSGLAQLLGEQGLLRNRDDGLQPIQRLQRRSAWADHPKADGADDPGPNPAHSRKTCHKRLDSPSSNSRRTGRIDANTNRRSQRSSENQRRWPNLNDKGQVSSRPAKTSKQHSEDTDTTSRDAQSRAA